MTTNRYEVLIEHDEKPNFKDSSKGQYFVLERNESGKNRMSVFDKKDGDGGWDGEFDLSC